MFLDIKDLKLIQIMVIISITTIFLNLGNTYSQQEEKLNSTTTGNSTLDYANTLGNISSTGNSTLDYANTLGNISSTGNSTLEFSGTNITNFTLDPILNRENVTRLISNFDYTNLCANQFGKNCVFWYGSIEQIRTNYHNQGGDISKHSNTAYGWIDNPQGENVINYLFGTVGASPKLVAAPGKWVGYQSQGLGIAITPEVNNINGLDLIVAWIDNPQHHNYANYYVGFDLDNNGNALGGWSDLKPIAPGKWIGYESQGAGLAVTNLDNDPRPELVFSWIDNPQHHNKAYYYVGYNMDENGNVLGGWSDLKEIDPGKWIGYESEAAGITIADLSNNGRPDLVFYHVDNPQDHNYAYYRIGYDLDSNGNILGGWTRTAQIGGSVGYHTDGGGIATNPFSDSNGLYDLTIFTIDNPQYDNYGKIRNGYANPP
jgi:hypothetical protein